MSRHTPFRLASAASGVPVHDLTYSVAGSASSHGVSSITTRKPICSTMNRISRPLAW